MDIICSKCGKHFSSIESSRKHSGHCSQGSRDEAVHWLPSEQSKLTSEEWNTLMRLINTKDKSARKKAGHLKNKQRKMNREKWSAFVKLVNTEDKSPPEESS